MVKTALQNRRRNELLVDRSSGPTLVAFLAEGPRMPRELARHKHERGQLLACSSGLLTVETRAGRWVMPPGRALWIPPGEMHAALGHGSSRAWSIYVATGACSALPLAPMLVAVTPLLLEAVARVARWPRTERRLTAKQERLAAVVLDEIADAPQEHLHLPMPRSPRLLGVARALAAKPDERDPLEAFARKSAMSRRTFTRRFREETGLSFGAWRTQLRMILAVERLVAGEPVTQIATCLGYASPSAFTLAFRRILGKSPTRFRTDGAYRVRT